MAAKIKRCSLSVSRYEAVINVLDLVTLSCFGSDLFGLDKLDMTGPTLGCQTLHRECVVVDTRGAISNAKLTNTGVSAMSNLDFYTIRRIRSR